MAGRCSRKFQFQFIINELIFIKEFMSFIFAIEGVINEIFNKQKNLFLA